ncbi:MAG: cytochrome c3 family protein [Deltaproteobacteria bacterium]
MSFNIIIKRYISEAAAEETRRSQVAGTRVNIGTGAGNEIQLDAPGVATKHAFIERASDGVYWLNILGDDGAYVNEKPLSGRGQLSDRDKIKISSYIIEFSLPASPENPAGLLITHTDEEQADKGEPSKKKKEEKIRYVSKFRISEGLFTKSKLSVLCIVLISAWIGMWTFGEDKAPYSPGKVSDAHSQFNNDCARCHTVAWDIVPDESCMDCHSATLAHNQNEPYTPNCVECHFEHQREALLSKITNTSCTECHAELEVEGDTPSTTYATQIDAFTKGHPEFAVMVRPIRDTNSPEDEKKMVRVRLNEEGVVDTTPIKLNHKLHLEADLRGPDGPETLRCESCHQMDAQGKYVLAIEYERDCKRCHTLEFDPRFGKLAAPHETMDVVRDFVRKAYSEYAINNLGRLGLGGDVTKGPAKWVSQRVEESEKLLFVMKKCRECHTIDESEPNTPQLVEPNIPVRWLPHSVFNHSLHSETLGLTCDSCHAEARSSEETTDVIMPSIQTCQSCHADNPNVKTNALAKTDCGLCHIYHKRDPELAGIEGDKSIKDLLRRK